MQTYGSSDIKQFLKVMDDFLHENVEVILIGGTAAALAYKVTRFTRDIDTFSSTAKVEDAHRQAQEKLGLKIPLEQAAVADAPYSFEDRLQVIDLDLRHLKVMVPEIHDLIMMKTMRAYEHDLEAIKEMVEKNTVRLEILKDRYLHEMDHVIGDRERLLGHFLAMIEVAFGTDKADDLAKELG